MGNRGASADGGEGSESQGASRCLRACVEQCSTSKLTQTTGATLFVVPRSELVVIVIPTESAMRFKTKPKSYPREGDTRVKTAFLWLPKKLDNEWRWFEKARYKQKLMRMIVIVHGGCYTPGNYKLKWVSTEWV
jgi:hypothetical protein